MFLEVIVSSFQCPHCGATDSSIQSGASLQDQGVKYSLKVHSSEVIFFYILMKTLKCKPLAQFDLSNNYNNIQIENTFA